MSSSFNKLSPGDFWGTRRRTPAVLGLLLAMLAVLGPSSMSMAQPPGDDRRIVLRFEGNRNLSERSLRQAADTELTAFIRNDGREADLADAAFQMELAYRAEGHAFAAVTYALTDREEILRGTIRIDEGPQVWLGEITFPGRSEAPAEALEALVLSPKGFFGSQELPLFVEAQVDAGAARIRDFYLARGFLDVTVGDPRLDFAQDRRRVRVAIPIDEGSRADR